MRDVTTTLRELHELTASLGRASKDANASLDRAVKNELIRMMREAEDRAFIDGIDMLKPKKDPTSEAIKRRI